MIQIIAEIGKNFINTEEDQIVKQYLANAIELVMEAKKTGANICKFQCHVFEDEKNKRSESRYGWIKRNEEATPYNEFWKPLAHFVLDNNLQFLVTPMSRMAAEKINNLVSMWKIGSADITDFELLEYIRSTKKPIIISTGMSNKAQVTEVLKYLRDSVICVMHCVSIYPCSEHQLNLNTIKYLNENIDCAVGFSDHSLSTFSPAIAVGMGATYIEKHFTLDRNAYGPDHKVSLLPHEFRQMVQNIHRTEHMLGFEDKILQEEEKSYWKSFRTQTL